MATAHHKDGKLVDITGPGITDRWGVTCADLGASVIAPNGTLVSVFGDTFSGNRVGEGYWRSPVILIGTGDADKGIILQRVRQEHVADPRKYSGWGRARGLWSWGKTPTPLTPAGETWGELSLRRLADGRWILGGFLSSEYALGYRVVKSPTAVRAAPLQHPIVGSDWDDEDHAGSRVAQLYGGYVLPGSKLDVIGGVGLAVSQWNAIDGWPYRAMQFRATLRDTTKSSPVDVE